MQLVIKIASKLKNIVYLNMNLFKKHKWKIGIGIIAFVISIYSFLFHNPYNEFIFGIIYKAEFFIFYFSIALLHIYFLEKFFFKRKYMVFFILTLIVVGTCSFLLSYFFSFRLIKNEDIEMPFKIFANTVGLILLVSLVTFFYVLRDRILMKTEYLAYNSRKLEAEVQLLRRQVNPHFLFNTLNSIYLKCLQNTPAAAEMIIQLAEMFRYELEISELETIPLEKEITFINNYISFERRRLPKNVHLTYNQEIDNVNLQISPNFILILIENCFKHGVVMNKESHITISLEIKDRQLTLKTENEIAKISTFAGTKQTGLKNLRKRLEYKYNNNFILHHSVVDNKCTAFLKIEL
jgi:hypothetical protein